MKRRRSGILFKESGHFHKLPSFLSSAKRINFIGLMDRSSPELKCIPVVYIARCNYVWVAIKLTFFSPGSNTRRDINSVSFVKEIYRGFVDTIRGPKLKHQARIEQTGDAQDRKISYLFRWRLDQSQSVLDASEPSYILDFLSILSSRCFNVGMNF